MFILEELSKAQAISEASMWSDKTADCSAEFIIYGSHMVYGSHTIAVYAAPRDHLFHATDRIQLETLPRIFLAIRVGEVKSQGAGGMIN